MLVILLILLREEKWLDALAIDKDGNVFKGDFNEFANDIKFIDISINEKKIMTK